MLFNYLRLLQLHKKLNIQAKKKFNTTIKNIKISIINIQKQPLEVETADVEGKRW